MNPQSSVAAAKPAAASTRPSAFRHLLFDRGVRFAIGLAVAVAIPVAVLFYFQFRSLSALEDTSAVVLRQLSGDTAESLLNDIDEVLKRPHIGMLLRLVQARLEPLDLAFVDPVFVQGLADSPFIEEAWIWSDNAVEHPEGDVGERTEKFYVFDRDSLKAPPTRMDERFREAPARQALVVPKVLEVAAQRRAIVAFPLTIDGRPKYVQIQRRFRGPDRQRVSSFIGFMVDAGYLRSTYFPSLLKKRLAAVQQPAGFPPLELYMLDGEGQTVDGRPAPSMFVDERTFPLIFFDKELLEYAAPYEQRRETWRIRAGYGAQTIPEIVSANTRPQMALMIVLALIMGGGVFFVAGAAAREVRVAELKSNFVASV